GVLQFRGDRLLQPAGDRAVHHPSHRPAELEVQATDDPGAARGRFTAEVPVELDERVCPRRDPGDLDPVARHDNHPLRGARPRQAHELRPEVDEHAPAVGRRLDPVDLAELVIDLPVRVQINDEVDDPLGWAVDDEFGLTGCHADIPLDPESGSDPTVDVDALTLPIRAGPRRPLAASRNGSGSASDLPPGHRVPGVRAGRRGPPWPVPAETPRSGSRGPLPGQVEKTTQKRSVLMWTPSLDGPSGRRLASMARGDCCFEVVEESLKYLVMKRIDLLTPDRLVFPGGAALDRVADNCRAFCGLELEPVLARNSGGLTTRNARAAPGRSNSSHSISPASNMRCPRAWGAGAI